MITAWTGAGARAAVPVAVLVTMLVTIALLAGCGESGPATTGTPGISTADLATTTVDIALVPRETTFDGSVEAVNEATVAAQTSGRVLELPYDVGDYVPKDALIVRLTDTEQRAREESARGAVAETRARLTEARANQERTRNLFERKLIAKSDLDSAIANLDSATARHQAAEAALREAGEQLGYTVIRAPYAGTVVARHVQVGESVAPGDPLLTGLSLESLRIVIEIPQQHIGPLRLHSQARVLLDDASIEVTELRIPPKADASSHTFRVLAMLPPGDHGVFPGTLVKVAFVSGEVERLLVPAAAVVQRGEVTGVYVVTPDAISLRYVRTGTPTADGDVPVLSGLQPGERVALDPLAAGILYKDGAPDPAGQASQAAEGRQ